MPFDPKTTKFPYPKDTDRHYLHVKKDNGQVFDKDYPFVDESKGFKFRRGIFRVLMFFIMMPIARIRTGLKIEGKKNLKKHKSTLKNGIISICNHIHMWDFIDISSAIWPHKPYVLSWAPDLRGENRVFIRYSGGIPIPEDDVRATIAYVRSVGKMLNKGGWLHIYAEGSMWEYYQPIRPFKRGVSYFAIKYDKPVLPMAYSFREPGFIRRKIFHQIATLTLHIGEPLYVAKALPQQEQEEDLTRGCHDAVCALAGIEPSENIYPPIYDQSKRIDYYASEYGVGYKGSW